MKDIQSASKGASAGAARSRTSLSGSATSGPARPLNADLLSQGSEVIRPFFQTLDALRDTVLAQAQHSDALLRRKLGALAKKIDSFEASVTLVGQAKAGKTALTHVLSGQPGLLPGDVSLWTPAITSLHVNAKRASRRTRARFSFFDPVEWDRIVLGGGRNGETDGRAGGAGHLAGPQDRPDEMPESAWRRLSPNIEALLGKSHRFSHVDRELIGRYVCVGDPEEMALNPQNQQGKFAGITKSAEIWLDVPQLSGSYLFRDTPGVPGVSDTFLLREQITLQALRGSKICVVVLSAHEALTTTDLALIRLISNCETRQVVLFVNRIDELEQPYEQISGIYESIHKTLRPYGRLRDVKVIFGSARWAEMALRGEIPEGVEDGTSALADWARNCDVGADPRNMTHLWKLSGIPELMRSINERIVDRSGARHLAAMRGMLANITAARAARKALVSGRDTTGRLTNVDPVQLRGDLEMLGHAARQKLEETLARLEGEIAPALAQVQEDYVLRATEALVEQLCKPGTGDTWTFNSSGLRLVLRTTCDRFSARARSQVESVFYGAASDLGSLCINARGLAIEGFSIEPPPVPKASPQVVLGKTIAIDLGRSWWKRWLQRRKTPATLAAEYRGLVEAGIGSAIDDLKQSQIAEVFAAIRRVFDEFIADQTAMVLDLAGRQPLAGHASEEGDDFGARLGSGFGAISLAEAPAEDPEGIYDTSDLRKVVGGN